VELRSDWRRLCGAEVLVEQKSERRKNRVELRSDWRRLCGAEVRVEQNQIERGGGQSEAEGRVEQREKGDRWPSRALQRAE
jgi:hypothetical protein